MPRYRIFSLTSFERHLLTARPQFAALHQRFSFRPCDVVVGCRKGWTMKRLWIWPLVMLFATGVLLAPAWGQVPGIRITPVLQTSTTLSGQSLQFPLFRNQVTSLLVEIAPGGENTRHQHPVPNLIYVLEGSVTIDTEGVGQRTFTAGQVFIEPVNQWHRAFNSGTVVHRAVAVFSGEARKSNFVRPPGLTPTGVRSTTILQTTTTAIGQPIMFPAFPSGITASRRGICARSSQSSPPASCPPVPIRFRRASAS